MALTIYFNCTCIFFFHHHLPFHPLKFIAVSFIITTPETYSAITACSGQKIRSKTSWVDGRWAKMAGCNTCISYLYIVRENEILCANLKTNNRTMHFVRLTHLMTSVSSDPCVVCLLPLNLASDVKPRPNPNTEHQRLTKFTPLVNNHYFLNKLHF